MYQIGFFLISFYILCSPCLTFRMSGWTLLKVYYLFFIYLYFIFILSKYTYDYIYIPYFPYFETFKCGAY